MPNNPARLTRQAAFSLTAVALAGATLGVAFSLPAGAYSSSGYSYNPSPSIYERCSNIAQQRSGYGGATNQGPGALGGAAAGALAGSWVGGWSGNAGSGAAWGAAFGLVAGAARKKNAQNEEDKKRSAYDSAFSECMNYHQSQQPSAPRTPVPRYNPAQPGATYRPPPTAPSRTPVPQITPAPAAPTPYSPTPAPLPSTAYPSSGPRYTPLPPIATPPPTPAPTST